MKTISTITGFTSCLLGISGGIVIVDGHSGILISTIGLTLSVLCVPLGIILLIYGLEVTRRTISIIRQTSLAVDLVESAERMKVVLSQAIKATYITGWLVALSSILVQFGQGSGSVIQSWHIAMSLLAMVFAFLLVELVLRPLKLRLEYNR